MKIKVNQEELVFDHELTAYEALASTGPVSREIIACEIDGKVCGLTTVITNDCSLKPLTFQDAGGKKVFWHTASHVLAQAVKRLFPETKLTIGPAIDNGFYYDFDSPTPFSAEILMQIEAEMKKIIKENQKLERFTLAREDAIKLMREKDEPYKVLLIERVPPTEEISFYKQGEFVDLCAGPHLFSTGAIKAFKLTQCTGAYWEGNAQNKQLQRIYGTAFPAKDQLNEYLTQQEEAKKRDHNKLGRELEYFTTSEVIGQGLPILLPKGARVIQTLQRWVEDEEEKRGYLLTKTPFMAKSDLYKISGHWDHYRDGMFILGNPDDDENGKECYALRPMTCPFQYQAYLNRKRSYRDLPMRLGETSTLFRNEDSGEMHGLIRVRQFTLAEGHLIIRPDQLEEEFIGCFDLAKHMLETLGLAEDCTYRFSKWDPENTDKFEGTAEQWEEAQQTMGKILDDMGIDYEIGIGEAAFYGPKLDIQMKNVHGKEDTIITIQIDMLLAEKFGMEYTDSDGKAKTPYIIHRSSLGCYERTLAMLIEKYAGALPMWLSPEQIRFLPIGDGQSAYAHEVADRCTSLGMKVTVDDRNEKIGYKIREAQLEKLPYMVIIGAKEVEAGAVSVRNRKGEDLGAMPIDAFIAKAQKEIANKAARQD